ncbi:Protein N-acetyltransferase, RimJ/RimL family [Terribacillus halophilus]|uniref:Protein N-acetyltransferase, RimJ/RimL family n=1 Tax=Terribacillus halophilus TaxID=361279 RepID=A0A1G6J854_9BACI|nr:GNAT family N-acetyltransferase [Terribacillus halophilus]SDC14900.1 Protein N-acetyltransferase, RimJ/RimL family [Terribacillus halophilus]
MLFDFQSCADGVLVRPLRKGDYSKWFSGFSRRKLSQHTHDSGLLDMTVCTDSWFSDLVDKHQRLAAEDKAYVFAVFKEADGSHLGMIDFSTLARDDFQWGRIGYTIHNQYWGNGYGKAAVRMALDIGASKLHYQRIEAHINLDNPQSIALAKSVGMRFECIRKGFIFENGQWTDHLVFVHTAQK